MIPLMETIAHQGHLNLNNLSSRLTHIYQLFEAQNPKLKRKKGYAQILKGKVPTDLKDINEGDHIEIMDIDYNIEARVTKTINTDHAI